MIYYIKKYWKYLLALILVLIIFVVIESFIEKDNKISTDSVKKLSKVEEKVNDIKTLFGQYEDLYKDMKTFLIHHTHILYKYMQQLLEPSIADYLKKQKEEKMDKLAEVAVTEDDCKVCTVLKQNVEAEYLNSCIDFWNDFKEAN